MKNICLDSPVLGVWLKLGIQVAFIKQSKTQYEIGRWYIWQHNKGIMSPRLCKYNMEKY